MTSLKSDPAFWNANILALSDALLLVERIPAGTIRLAYIDPPLFPTEPFDTQGEARVMRSHLLNLSKVLLQVRRSLAHSGNIFLHSEPQMNGSMRLLLDQ